MYFRRIFFASVIIVISVLFGIKPAFAQTATPLNITLSPVYFDLSANPGQIVKETIMLRNNTTLPMTLTIGLKKIVPDTTGNITIQDLGSQDQTGKWFHFSNTHVNALPQEITEVPFTITIPKNAAYGYYLAISFTKPAPTTKANETVAATAAIPVLLNVRSPGAKTAATIVTFTTKNFINQYMPVDFITSIKNTGNIHIRPAGTIFVRNNRDKDLAILNINQAGGDIIPGEIRTFPASWDDGFIVNEPVMEDGQVKTDKYGRPVNHLVVHWDKITSMRFGEYTASLLVVYNNGLRDVALEANTSFWVIPYTLIAAVIIGILVVIILIRFFLRWYVKQAIKKVYKK